MEVNYKTVLGQSTMFDCITASAGESFLSLDSNKWIDLNTVYKDTNICIKGIATTKTASNNQVDNSSNSNQSTNNNQSTNQNSNNDNTIAKINIPNAGAIKFGIIILIVGTTLIISAYKTKKYKIVK